MNLLKKIYEWQFFRFVVTGALNTLFGYLLYALGYFVTKNETFALVFDYVVSIAVNFKSYSMLVFNNRDNSKIVFFALSYLGVFALNRASLFLFIDLLHINSYLAQLISLSYIPLILFFVLKFLVFKKHDGEDAVHSVKSLE